MFIDGSLVSRDFAESHLRTRFAGRLGEASGPAGRRLLARALRDARRHLGPASSLRSVLDRAAVPLLGHLGFRLTDYLGSNDGRFLLGTLQGGGPTPVGLVVAGWLADLDTARRPAVQHSIGLGAAWCWCFNGRQLRLVDAVRPFSRAHLQFDLPEAIEDDGTFPIFWGLCRSVALVDGPGGPGVLSEAAAASESQGLEVRQSLQTGVRDALVVLATALWTRGGRRHAGPQAAARVVDHALTVIYRLLFLAFAEARSLVPLWHPIYRRSYSVEHLRRLAEAPGGSCRGLWPAVQAISRLAHAGCRVADLRVTAFNGRLFAPSHAPMLESIDVGDAAAQRLVISLTTTPGRHGRERIAYADLGVEQLGAVYERVLEYEADIGRPAAGAAGAATGRQRPVILLSRSRDRRKASGTFYTPATMTDYLVRRTLEPLVRGASPEAILALRVLDPAMGSGAFLVAACRYLSSAYEIAHRESTGFMGERAPEDRAETRRTIAQRCLFGVDLNPSAVQLARLSLWLTTLASDRPLTFLDHHLRTGDSLLGASLDDVHRQPPGVARRTTHARLPLFERDRLGADLVSLLPERLRLSHEPDDSPAVVRRKERTLAHLDGDESPLFRWKALADLWMALWFWPDSDHPGEAGYLALRDSTLSGQPGVAAGLQSRWHSTVRQTTLRHGFFHWHLEFPEVFFDTDGARAATGGFDAVLGNPPWDMVRSDGRSPAMRAEGRAAGRVVRFARQAGVYRSSGDGHLNRYQLFLERSLQLLRPGGRFGLVLPSGLATDQGAGALRRRLLDSCELDGVVGFENHHALFPIHRSVKFLLLTATLGRPSRRLRCRFRVRDPSILDSVPGSGSGARHFPVELGRDLLERLAGDDLAIPDVADRRDLIILEQLASRWPRLGSADGWGARFGRELNATEDRHRLADGRGPVPVVEGKQIEAFRVRLDRAQRCVAPGGLATLRRAGRWMARPRLAYRDVAGAGNRWTLIAAVLPANAVSVHTVFCLKPRLDLESQYFLCGLLNSFVANYVVRHWVGTHVTTSLVERLPAPSRGGAGAAFGEVAGLARTFEARPARPAESARLQALVARAYGLTRQDLEYVLDTFPLVPADERRLTLQAFDAR